MSFFWYEGGIRSVRQDSVSATVGAAHIPDHATTTPHERKINRNPYTAESQPKTPKRQPAVIARQIMTTNVVCIPTDTPFDEIWSLIKAKRFRHVPVVGSNDRLQGVISDRDVLREAAAAAEQAAGSWFADVIKSQKTAEDFMTKRILVATPTTEIRLIAKAMFEERIGSMPIIDEAHKVVGLITRSDILRTLVNSAPIELWI